MLPYVLAFNAVQAPEATCRIAAPFGSNGALDCLRRLRAACSGTDLADLARYEIPL
jgi:alcohol dehydrogenase class IV